MTPEQFKAIEDELAEGRRRMDIFDELIEENRRAHAANAEALKKNTELTEEIRDIMVLGKAFFSLASYVGKFLKWAAGIAAAVATFWAMFNGVNKS